MEHPVVENLSKDIKEKFNESGEKGNKSKERNECVNRKDKNNSMKESPWV